jgi:hypothetical protein
LGNNADPFNLADGAPRDFVICDAIGAWWPDLDLFCDAFNAAHTSHRLFSSNFLHVGGNMAGQCHDPITNRHTNACCVDARLVFQSVDYVSPE